MALIAQLREHCTGIAEVVGSNPAQSLKIFSGLCSSSVTAALALMTVIRTHVFQLPGPLFSRVYSRHYFSLFQVLVRIEENDVFFSTEISHGLKL